MLKYKFDVLSKLKENGYNTYKLKTGNYLPQSTIQKLRTGKMVGIESIDKICKLLDCQPGDIMFYTPDNETPADRKDYIE